MTRIVLTFGLIMGAIIIGMFALTLPFHDRMSPEAGMVVGFSSMIAASLLVYFGVRQYRDTVAGGSVGFGRAFGVGLLIVAVSNLVYALVWQVIFFGFMPDYLEKYQARMLETERANGATPERLAAMRADNARMAENYRNPLFNIAITFTEPLPIGIPAALITALLLRRRRPRAAASDAYGTAGQSA